MDKRLTQVIETLADVDQYIGKRGATLTTDMEINRFSQTVFVKATFAFDLTKLNEYSESKNTSCDIAQKVQEGINAALSVAIRGERCCRGNHAGTP